MRVFMGLDTYPNRAIEILMRIFYFTKYNNFTLLNFPCKKIQDIFNEMLESGETNIET